VPDESCVQCHGAIRLIGSLDDGSAIGEYSEVTILSGESQQKTGGTHISQVCQVLGEEFKVELYRFGMGNLNRVSATK
jgi:hypothetical protein